MKNIEIYNEDFYKFSENIEDNSIDLIVTDPPFGVNLKNDIYDDTKESILNRLDEMNQNLSRILKKNSHIYMFVPTQDVEHGIISFKKYFKLNNIISTKSHQNKYNSSNFSFKTQFVLFGSKEKPKKFNKIDIIEKSKCWLKDPRNKNKYPYTYCYPNLLNMYSDETNLVNEIKHINRKSIKILEFFIKISSNKNDLVLDPFFGSCSTGFACKNTERRFLGIELNKDIFLQVNKKINE